MSKKILIQLFIIAALALTFILTGIMGGIGNAYAETEMSEVMRDLNGLTLDGREFNIEDYPEGSDESIGVIYLKEQGFNGLDDLDNYNLYVYIYNPALLNINYNMRNTVEMRIGNAQHFTKYRLSFVSSDYGGRFIKLRITFSGTALEEIKRTLFEDERRYEISSVEFFNVGGWNAVDYAGTSTLLYKYWGRNDNTTCELSYTEFGGEDVIPIDVHHTTWRPEGTNGTRYTQDSLTSVYFAVPKEYAYKYDKLVGVKCEWIQAVTKPMIVTDNEEFINTFGDFLRKLNEEVNYGVVPEGSFDWDKLPWMGLCRDELGYFADNPFAVDYSTYLYNSKYQSGVIATLGFGVDSNTYYNADGGVLHSVFIVEKIPQIYVRFFKEGDDISVSSEEVLAAFREQNFYFDNDMVVAGKYPSYLFESWDEEPQEHCISIENSNDYINLTSEKFAQTWSEHFFGKSHIASSDNYNEQQVQAIRKVESGDLTGSDKEISDKLFISDMDVQNFKNFYNSKAEESDIYLLRIACTDYFSRNFSVLERKFFYNTNYDGKGYLAKETVFLDFDIIDFTYKKGDKYYVIPVKSNPIDIISGIKPPPEYLVEPSDFWKWGCGIIGGLVGILIVYIILAKVTSKK